MNIWHDITNTFNKVEKRCEHAVKDLNAEAHAAAHSLSSEAHDAAKALSQRASAIKRELAPLGHAVTHTAAAALHGVVKLENDLHHQELLFGEGIVTNSVLNPVNSLTQMSNHMLGTHIKKIEFANQKEVDNSFIVKAGKFMQHQEMLFGEGVVTGAVLNPVNALEQVSNQVFGTHLKKIEFANQKEVDHSFAGVAGEIAGTVAVFVLTDGAASAATGLEAGSIGTMAIAGAVQNGLLTPSKEGVGGMRFLQQRLAGAAVGATAAATTGFVGGKLSTALKGLLAPEATGVVEGVVTPALESNVIPAAGKVIPHEIVRHGISNTVGGGAGGLVQAELQSLAEYGRFASARELQTKIGLGAASWTPPQGWAL